MPEKTLGVDIGEKCLKAVLAVREMRGGYKVKSALTIDITGPGGVTEAIGKLREAVDFHQVVIALSLPARFVSFHNVRMPFSEGKKIRQTIAYELETELPHSIDEYLIDYRITSSEKHGEVFAALVPRSVVKERVSLFPENQALIRKVEIDALPVASWLAANGAFAGTGLLIDVGARDSVAVFMQAREIVQVRRYAFGADFLQDAGEHRDVDSPEFGAQTEENASAVPETILCKFCRDLKNTLEFVKWRGNLNDSPARIFLTGEGSCNGLIREELSRFFSLSVETADVASLGGIKLPDEIKVTWEPSLMNQALALALLPRDRAWSFKFAPLEPATRAVSGQFRSTLKWGAAALSIIFVLAAADAYLDYRYARIRLDNLKKQINTLFKSAAPDVARIVDPVQQLKTKIAEIKKISMSRRNINEGATVLDILKDISALVPAQTELLITSFVLDDDRLVIKGTAKNFDSVDIIKKELSKSKQFKSVEVGTTSLMKQGDKVEFDLRVTARR